jgi:hypothetical protein
LSIRSNDWLYGLELAKVTGLKSGSLYPILIRLADRRDGIAALPAADA